MTWQDRARSALVPYVQGWELDAAVDALDRILGTQLDRLPSLPDAGLLGFRLNVAERKLDAIRALTADPWECEAIGEDVVRVTDLREIFGPDA